MGFIKILFIIFVAIAFGGGLLYGVYKTSPEFLNLSRLVTTTDISETRFLDEVSSLIDLPIGEKPIISVVENLDNVRSQSFFKKAKLGDKVIIYMNHNRAILYRPFEKKIIEVGIINVGQLDESTSSLK